MELLDYFALHVPSNIYGLAHIAGERNRLLISTLNKKMYCIESSANQLTCNDIHFAYIPNGAEIISIAAFSRANANDVLVGITYCKDSEDLDSSDIRNELEDAKNEEFKDAKKDSKYFFNIYSSVLQTNRLDLNQIAQDCQTIELDFVPTHLQHSRLDTRTNSEIVWLMGGSDLRVHTFRQPQGRQTFYKESNAIYCELNNLPSVPLWIDTITLPINQSTNEQAIKTNETEDIQQNKPGQIVSAQQNSDGNDRKKKDRKGRTERRRKDKGAKKEDNRDNRKTAKEARAGIDSNKETRKRIFFEPEFVRYTAIAMEDGTIMLYETQYSTLHLQGQITRKWSNQFDCPVLCCRFLRDRTNSSTKFPPKLDANHDDEIHLLALNSIESPVVYRNVTRKGTEDCFTLPVPKQAEIFVACFIGDYDFDAHNELLIGTFGNEILVYKYRHTKQEYALVEKIKYRNPIHSICYTDLTGNGIKDLAVVTSSGVVVQRHNLDKIISMLTYKVDECLKTFKDIDDTKEDGISICN